MALEWDDRLNVGNDTIDRQHRELFSRFGSFIDACQQRRGKDEIASLLFFLGDYVNSHFSDEERLMARHSYPDIAAHRKEHRDFTQQLEELVKALEQDGPTSTLVISTNQAMLSWVVRHIKTVDIKLGAFLREQVR